MITSGPKRSRRLSRARSRAQGALAARTAAPAAPRPASSRFVRVRPDQRQAPPLDRRQRGGEQPAGRREDHRRLRAGLEHRVGARRAREVVEAQPQDNGAADPPGGAQAPGHAVHEGDRGPRRASSQERGPRRPSERCEPIERRRRPVRTRRGSRLCARAWSWRPAARPSRSTSSGSPSRATWPTVRSPALVQLSRGHRADPPQALDRQGMEEGRLLAGRRPRAARRAWPPRWPPSPGAWSAPPRP